jgi:hypothetical protein
MNEAKNFNSVKVKDEEVEDDSDFYQRFLSSNRRNIGVLIGNLKKTNRKNLTQIPIKGKSVFKILNMIEIEDEDVVNSVLFTVVKKGRQVQESKTIINEEGQNKGKKMIDSQVLFEQSPFAKRLKSTRKTQQQNKQLERLEGIFDEIDKRRNLKPMERRVSKIPFRERKSALLSAEQIQQLQDLERKNKELQEKQKATQKTSSRKNGKNIY